MTSTPRGDDLRVKIVKIYVFSIPGHKLKNWVYINDVQMMKRSTKILNFMMVNFFKNSLLYCWVYIKQFVWVISSHSRMFHSYGDFAITGQRLQIFTYARASWPLSSDSFKLATHTVTSVYNGHHRGPVTLAPIAERLAMELSLPVFTT